MRGSDAARLKVLSLTLLGSSEGRCRPRHVLSTHCNAVAVDSAVDEEHASALQSLKLAVEGRRTTAGVEGGPVVRQKTTEEVIHRLLGRQALILALQMIGAEIYASSSHKAGSLKWFERYRGYGFPVGCNLRDLLIGDDTTL
jgi:hypothetical protein